MKPLKHAENSVRKHGGKVDDYLMIHNFLDSSKALVPDMRHRALYHHSAGCFLAEQLYGVYFENSDGKMISTRDIAEEHVIEDMGTIPTPQDYLEGMPLYNWLGGRVATVTKYSLVD